MSSTLRWLPVRSRVKVETEAKEAAQAQAAAAENEANEVTYYAIGTAKELKQRGLLEEEIPRYHQGAQG